MTTSPSDSEDLVFRQDYFRDHQLWAGLVDLLRDTFSIDVGLQDLLGGPDPSSMPFGYFDAGNRCVANFSAFSMPVIINGKRVRAAGFQSGAVRPEWRCRGLYRDLLQRTFRWTDAQGFDLGILLTDKPGLYEPYGFRIIPQHHFIGAVPEPYGEPIATTPLLLPRDLKMLRRRLKRRRPVSRYFAPVHQTEMFLLNACFDPDIQLTHFLAENAVIAWKVMEGNLHLLDIVAEKIPSVTTIVAGLNARAERLQVFFSPDLLDWQGFAVPHGGHTQLMMRGQAAADIIAPVMLSPMADF